MIKEEQFLSVKKFSIGHDIFILAFQQVMEALYAMLA